MLKYYNYDIVFQEIPDEVTLAINITNCPNLCVGCHSPHLRENIGENLDEYFLSILLEKYKNSITCICFMGGDANVKEVAQLANFVREKTKGVLKTGWYSGKNKLSDNALIHNFNYIKLGEYIETKGSLKKKTTNQRLYQITHNEMVDITSRLQ